MKTCIVIYNPNSGHTLNKKNIPRYKSIIESYGYKVDFIGTQYKGHAKEIVSHIGYVDLIISMGGDGTFNEIVYGNLQRKQKLLVSHIPIGTTNDIGNMFGYTSDIEKNIKACLNGEIKEMDIPLINKRPFVYVAGFGRFLNIPYDTPREEKLKLGYFAYIFNGIKDFFTDKKRYHIKYEIDGKKYETDCTFMIVCSATSIAGFSNFFSNVKLDDDKFEILICTQKKRLDILGGLSLMVLNGAEKVDGFLTYKTSNIKVQFDKYTSKAWCIDGELLEIRTKKYEIDNYKGFKILIPQKNINKLFINK